MKLIIIVEGPKGSKKTELVDFLKTCFAGKEVRDFSEPYGVAGEHILSRPNAEEESFWDNRIGLWHEHMLPLVSPDRVLIVKKSWPSTYANQLMAKEKFNLKDTEHFLREKNGLLKAFEEIDDIVIHHIYIRMSPEQMQTTGGTADEIQKLQVIRSGYDLFYKNYDPNRDNLEKRNPLAERGFFSDMEKVTIVDGSLPFDEMCQRVKQELTA